MGFGLIFVFLIRNLENITAGTKGLDPVLPHLLPGLKDPDLSGLRAAVGAYLARRDQAPRVVYLGTRVFVSVSVQLTPQQQIIAAIPLETWTLLWTRLGRTAARVTALFNRWRAGTLPTPTPAPARPRPVRPAPPRLPTRRNWVIAAVGYQAAGHASQLNALMAEPEFQTFITEVPQSGRLLRPLCRLLGITPLPPPLALPSKPSRARPPRPRPSREPKLRAADLRRPRLPPIMFPSRKKTA